MKIRNRMIKRWISALLVFCLTAGLLPVQIPRAVMSEVADTQIVLDFKKEWEKPENERRSPLDASIAVDGWQVNQEKTAASLITGSTTFKFQPYGINARVMDATYPKHSDLAIDFAVESEGVYNVSFSGGQYGETDGATVGIYVDDVHLGNYRFVGDNLLVGENKDLGGIALMKGTHTVTMRRVNGGNPSFMFPGCISFSLTKPMRTEKTLNFIAAHAKEYLGGTSGTPLDATIETHGWQLNREKSAGSITTSLKPGYQNYGIVAQINDANYEKHSDLVFDFNLDKEADYIFSLSGSQYDGGTIVDVYVDAQKVGSYDFSGSAGMGGNIAVFPKLHLTNGEHSVTLRRTAGADGGRYMFPGQIRIVEDMTALNFGIQTFDKDGNPKANFSAGDTVYAKVMLDGGSDFQFGAVQADIVYDKNRFELVDDSTTANGSVVINKNYGGGNDTVRFAYGGAAVSAQGAYLLGTIALRVKDDAAGGNTALLFKNAKAAGYNSSNWSPGTAVDCTVTIKSSTQLLVSDVSVNAGEQKRVEITANRNGAPIGLHNAEISVSGLDTSLAQASIVRDGDRVYLNVLGSGVGKGAAVISAVIGGETVKKTISVEVTELCYYYNYRKLWGGKVHNVGTDITMVNSYSMTTTGSEDEINKDTGIHSEPWMYGGADKDGTGKMFFSDNIYACQIQGETGWNAIKIQVPKDGIYEAVAVHSYWTGGGSYKIFLAPLDAENPRSDIYLLGTLDGYGETNQWVCDVPLKNVILQKGEYIITYQAVAKNPQSQNSNSCVTGLKLKTANADSLTLLTQEADAIAVDKSIELPLSAYFGTESVSLKDVESLTVKSDDTDIADASIVNDASGNPCVLVSGKKIGAATVTVSATLRGKSAQIVIPVIIADPKEFRGVSITIPNSALSSGDLIQAQISAALMDGTQVDLSKTQYYFESSDPKVASVDNTGKILAKQQGNATITVYLKKDGLIKQDKVSVSVTDPSKLATVTLAKIDTLSSGDKITLNLTALRESGYAADLSNAEIVYHIEDGEIAGIENGVLTAKNQGTTQVFATVKLEGTAIDSLPISVVVSDESGGEVFVDFRTNQTDLPEKATIDAQGWKLNREKSTPNVTTTNQLGYQSYGASLRIYDANNAPYSDFAFDFKLPKSGNYAMEFRGYTAVCGAVAAIYIDDVYLGTFDFYTVPTVAASQKLNSVALDAGIHTVTLRRVNTEGFDHFYMTGLVCSEIAELPEIQQINIELPQEELTVGEKMQCESSVQMSDESTRFFGNAIDGGTDAKNYISFQSETPDILEVAADGMIKALKAGEGIVKVTACVNGVTKTETKTIAVRDTKLASITAELENKALFAGSESRLILSAKLSDEREIALGNLAIEAKSSDENVFKVQNTQQEYTVVAVGMGDAQLTVNAELAGSKVSAVLDIHVSGDGFATVEVSADPSIMKPTENGTQLQVTAKNNRGEVMSLDGAQIAYTNHDPEIVSLSETGFVKPVGLGEAKISVEISIGSVKHTGTIYITIRDGKTKSTYYTEEKVAAAQENVQKYAWADAMRDTAEQKAKKYLDKTDYLWNAVTTQELPRAAVTGYRYDPDIHVCRYCGSDMLKRYGGYGWIRDPLVNVWKLQCPDCRRKFPSNDFEGFYKLGIDESGNWSYALAKEKNAELVANGEDGFLKNILYPEKNTEVEPNWGVDDGYGYHTGRTYANGVEEVHTYIAYYNHWDVWYGGIVWDALATMRDAYLYTGDERYGRIGAILIDRVADVYPDMKIAPYFPHFFNSDSTQPNGKVVGAIWETELSEQLAFAYDAFFPMMDDPQVISFLSEKATQYNMKNAKDTPDKIRKNCEDNILREIFKACKESDIFGNFGTHQAALAIAAVALDTSPESEEMIDWIYKSGGRVSVNSVTGGDVERQIINVISRDGLGDESSPQYSNLWVDSCLDMADALKGYRYERGDLYKHPKFIKMLSAGYPLILTRNQTAQIGDSSNTARLMFNFYDNSLLRAYHSTGIKEIAQILWHTHKNDLHELHYDIFTRNPESVQNDVRRTVEQYGEYDFDRSLQLCEYGFAILRDGTYQESVGTQPELNTQRDMWLYHGNALRHGHLGTLNLGIEAYGLNIAPDLGYPEVCDGSDSMLNWNHSTISHNTIMVNEVHQNRVTKAGMPLHFDDAGQVKLMDIDAPDVYNDVSIFRRSVVMVRVDDEISYGVDFFRVKGGRDHLYSFHALSNDIAETTNLNFVSQPMGTYAGAKVEWATPGYTSGYSWLYNVRRADDPRTGSFSVDFKITDFRSTLNTERDIHLRVNMLNDFNVDEVSLAKGKPPQVAKNPEELEFLLVRRKGSNLDSLFTTVFEPYDGERYIESIEAVSVMPIGTLQPSVSDVSRAVKVTLKSGRVDYIVYSSNSNIEYRVDDLFDFKGFAGVYTLKDGEPIYTYLNDGEKLGTLTGTAAYTGQVVDFTRTLTDKNTITVQFDSEISTDELVGRYINIDNDRAINAVYPIENATVSGDNVILDIGDLTLARSLKDIENLAAGYVYNIAEGQTFRIPLSTADDTTPAFAPINSQSVEVGSELSFTVSATSPVEKELTYRAKALPRGAQFDPETQTFSWIPDSGLLGKQYATFEVTDGTLSATQNVEITVYNSASGGGTGPINNPSPGTGGSTDPIDPNPPVVTVEEDEVKFAASTEETTADTKLGSVTFPNGTFAEDGQGTLKIKKENEKFSVSVSATVDMEEKPTKVSLNYTPADNMTDKNCIVVKDANGNIIPNGKYADGKMTFYTDTFGDFTIVYNPKSFTDLGNHAWADDAITRLAARGIINGITATTYGPARKITRADFTTLIVRAFGFEGEVASFADVPANAYYAEPVGIAKTLGIVGGVNESDFAPTAEITRQDMMVIVARALDKAGYVLDASESPEFSDTAEVADYAKDAVQMLTASGIIAGSNGKINPKGKTTRAEVAVILDRIVFMAR